MSVSAPGDTAVVWAPFDDDNGVDTGSEYVFKLSACEAIPAVSAWGMVAMTLLVLTTGTLVYMRSRPARAQT